MLKDEDLKTYVETTGNFYINYKDEKVFRWTFPITTTLEDNYEMISKLTEILKNQVERKKKEIEEEKNNLKNEYKKVEDNIEKKQEKSKQI